MHAGRCVFMQRGNIAKGGSAKRGICCTLFRKLKLRDDVVGLGRSSVDTQQTRDDEPMLPIILVAQKLLKMTVQF